MKSWKDTLTPEQVEFLSSLRHASMSIQNEIEEIQKLFEKEEKQ